KFLPNVPSPLVYRGVLYLVKDGGIVTSLDPRTGRILKQGRLAGAVDTYYSSPVAGTDRGYMISQTGQADVHRRGARGEGVAVTGPDGVYNFLYLPVGTDTVATEKAGFHRAEAVRVLVNVNTTVRLDVQLTVGELEQMVEVTAAAPLLTTEGSNLGKIVPTKA